MLTPARIYVISFVLGIIAGTLAVVSQGDPRRVPLGDGKFYVDLSRSLAAGKGYVSEMHPWQGLPHLSRLPLWPAILTIPAWMFPSAPPYAVLRGTAVVMHGLCALLLAILTYRLFESRAAAMLAGAIFAFYPAALAIMEAGLSEHAWAAFAIGGLIILVANPRSVIGALIFGVACLSRANFVIMPGIVALIAIAWRPNLWRQWRAMAALSAAFVIPAALWIARNYAVSGAFPILSALEGETLYGANNARVATDLSVWGYWIFPDLIPGETPKQELGKHVSEAEINFYYRSKALQFIRSDWVGMPRLIVGKLVRGFVPVPWVPNVSSYVASVCRLALYAAFFWVGMRYMRGLYGLIVLGIFILITITTIVYYGSFRFTFCGELFLMPCVAYGLSQLWSSTRRMQTTEALERASVSS